MQPRPDEPILTVSDLNREARELLESGLPGLWVEGEISGFIHHGSGHMYFTLKDDRAEIRCAMFRGANRHVGFRPENGLQVLLQGKVTIYEARGSYQIVVEQMEPAGEGLLRRRLEALKARLQAEGLFAAEHKQPLPALPRCVGVITSPTGAAIRDILKVLRRRFPAVPVIIYPAQVQGERAKGEIAAALATAARRNECDVLICGRGGGSLEDLWSFNEEQVVRAIFECPLPVISAVGHESDVTLADLVADLRAPTPSAAAELAVPDAAAWRNQVASATRRGMAAIRRELRNRTNAHQNLAGRLRRRNPRYVLRQYAQRIDELIVRLRRGALTRVNLERSALLQARARLVGASPAARCPRHPPSSRQSAHQNGCRHPHPNGQGPCQAWRPGRRPPGRQPAGHTGTRLRDCHRPADRSRRYGHPRTENWPDCRYPTCTRAIHRQGHQDAR